MKNKPMVYVLVAAVVLVWGIIGYRVYSRFSDNSDTTQFNTIKPIKEGFNDYSPQKDTARLQLNYRDPFGITVHTSDTLRSPISHPQHILAGSNPPLAFSWDFIKYSGYLQNPASKKLIAFLTINGRDVNMAEGENIDNVRLLKNLRDSVKISFNGKIKYIPLRTKN